MGKRLHEVTPRRDIVQLQHDQWRDYYLNLEDRSYKKVAEHFGKAEEYIRRVGARQGWVALAEAKDLEDRKRELAITGLESAEYELRRIQSGKTIIAVGEYLTQRIVELAQGKASLEEVEKLEGLSKTLLNIAKAENAGLPKNDLTQINFSEKPQEELVSGVTPEELARVFEISAKALRGESDVIDINAEYPPEDRGDSEKPPTPTQEPKPQ